MIKLRELRKDDAKPMLSWMHDPVSQRGFQRDILNAGLSDTEEFCQNAKLPEHISEGVSCHFAIADDDSDEYFGTVSIKDISLRHSHGEYAIALCPKARGRGIAKEATMLLLKKAFFEYGLNRVFLSVLPDNEAAIRLYEKCGFKYEGSFRKHIKRGDEFLDWKWYGILKEEYAGNK